MTRADIIPVHCTAAMSARQPECFNLDHNALSRHVRSKKFVMLEAAGLAGSSPSEGQEADIMLVRGVLLHRRAMRIQKHDRSGGVGGADHRQRHVPHPVTTRAPWRIFKHGQQPPAQQRRIVGRGTRPWVGEGQVRRKGRRPCLRPLAGHGGQHSATARFQEATRPAAAAGGGRGALGRCGHHETSAAPLTMASSAPC